MMYSAYSLVGFWAGLDWLVLVLCERKTLLVSWFRLIETNKRTESLLTAIFRPFDDDGQRLHTARARAAAGDRAGKVSWA